MPSMQELGKQVAELNISGEIRLKKPVYLPDELALALSADLKDPKVYAVVLKDPKGA